MEARKIATYQDILQLPEHLIGEILDGELHTSPRPAPRHANASSRLGARLKVRFDLGEGGPGGWWILFESELHLSNDILVPDLAGWRRERMPQLPDVAWFATRPDWVCEVLSPSTGWLDRGRKLDKYLQAGIPWAWLVDPALKVVEVFKASESGWLRHTVESDGEAALLPPFEAVPFDVRSLWDDGRPAT